MAIGKAMVKRLAQRAAQTAAKQTEAGNLSSPGQRPSYEAVVKGLDDGPKVPNYRRGRSPADLIPEPLVRKALEGGVRAFKKIRDRAEGRVSRRSG